MESAQRASTFVQDLVSLARKTDTQTNVLIAPLVDSAIASITPVFGSRVNVQRTPFPSEPLKGSPERLQQLFLNLLLLVCTHPKTRGIGIDCVRLGTNLRLIFRSSNELNLSTFESMPIKAIFSQKGGHWMALAVAACHRIAREHRGTVVARSVGAGAEIEVEVAVAEVETGD